MSVVSLLGVNILNNPAKLTDKYELEITFECLEQLEKGSSHLPLPSYCHAHGCFTSRVDDCLGFRPVFADFICTADLEWKLTYVGSATS